MKERNGNRKPRSQRRAFREPCLGYYYIVTDTKETEKNYFDGLRDSLPESLQGKLVVKVATTGTGNLLDFAKEQSNLHPQYCEPWIVFDRDQVQDFDKIIERAEQLKVNVGWSNPCIETWFYSYYGKMPRCKDSVACWKRFATQFEKITGQEYDKADKSIYNKLCATGDETKAIQLAERKLKQYYENGFKKPSDMNAASTIFKLIREIRKKVTAG